MPETALVVSNNSSHNVLATLDAAKTRLTDLATLYLVTEVAGQSQATLDAKRRDLQRFLVFYYQLYGDDRPEEWFVSVTKAFLKQLRGQRFAQASLVRISEILQLDRNQYDGKGFAHVQVKGGQLRDFVPVQRDARAVLDQWLEQQGDAPGPLFPTRSNRRLSRREAANIMQRIAGQANANRPQQEHIQVSPHVLRHTFLRKLAEEKGVHYAREASGHQSDRYIWRYVKLDRQTLAEAIDDLE